MAPPDPPSTSSANNSNVVIHRNLNIKPFVKQTDANETAVKWQRYKKDIERQFRFFGISDADTKKDGLLIYGGGDLVDIDEALPDPASQDDDDVYKVLIRKLDSHFMPKKNKDFARFQMSEMKQQTHESLAEYYAKIRDIARKCDYGTHEDDAIRDHLIRTMNNNKIRSKAIKDNLTLDKILTETAVDEQTKQQAGAISKKLDSERNAERIVKKVETRRPEFQGNQQRSSCLRCGSSRRHQRDETCPAMGATCNNCGKLNHYARVCLGKPQQQQGQQGNNQRRDDRQQSRHNQEQRNYVKRDQPQHRQGRTRHVEKDSQDEERHSDDSYDSSDDECYMQHLSIHHTRQHNNSGKTCTVQINGINIQTEPDTGSDANIMDENQFTKLQHHAPEVTLKSSKIKLKALKEDLPVIGESDVTITNQTRTVCTTLIIIKGTIDSPPLLGRETLEALGMVLIDATGGLKEPNRNVRNVQQQRSDAHNDKNTKLNELVERYKERFTGIGKAMRDGHEIHISIPMKDDATPIAQKPRRVPYLLTDPLKKRIEEFVENDIVEQVPQHEAITWCSPLVVQPKPKNPKDIRACLDLRVVNKSMLRTRQVQAPITEDFISEFKGCTIFSKLDMNHGYHQFALDEESRRIMTFSTPWGNYRYKRLAFGGLNSQDLFDAEMAKVISGIPRVLNNRDDIMIGGFDWEDHNKNLRMLLQRIEDHNLTLRREKCEFGKTTLNFHGHLFTANGLQPSPDKIKAVNDCKPPNTREELVSFLQMLAYLSRYIDNFSSRCEPLRRITRDKVKFDWSDEQQAAFEDLKHAITSAPVLVPFYPERETLIICDGSPTGLGGGLFQQTQHGYQPVHYVSRTLTDTESRYSQIEREALSVQFTTSRLEVYLLGGKHFKIATDHKPLLPLFNNPHAKLPPRIERMVMKMQNLDFTMIHIPGKENVADYMSRHPLPEKGHDSAERHVKAVTTTDHAIVLEKIAAETKTDKELQHLKHTLRTGNWKKNDPVLKPYTDLQAEIYEAENILLRLNRIIPPQNLREKIIRVAHNQGHLGISKTKEMIRHKYWWPGMNMQVENIVNTCFECQIATVTTNVQPAKMTELPERPWMTVEVDFCGPFPNGEYALVITDQYSRYPEVEFTRTTAFESTRKKLKKVFSTHGIPEVVQTDNGPPFNSHAFHEFADEMGFRHKCITPLHPKAQGQVEGFNKLVNKIDAIARQDNIDPQEAILDMLQAYRSTPHPSTKTSPYQLLMGREVRTKLDHFKTDRHDKDEDVRKNDTAYKERHKAYHDKRHKAKEHTLKHGDAVVVKRDSKRKGQTPYEPFIYIVTNIKGSQITAARIKDERTIRRDASKFKPLKAVKTQRLPDEHDTTQRYNAIPNCVESTPVPALATTQAPAIAPEPAEIDQATISPAQPRRSERQRKSTQDGKYKDYDR